MSIIDYYVKLKNLYKEFYNLVCEYENKKVLLVSSVVYFDKLTDDDKSLYSEYCAYIRLIFKIMEHLRAVLHLFEIEINKLIR